MKKSVLMNVFVRELKFYRKSLIFWSIGMIFLVWSGMVKYDTFQNTSGSINDLISQFPQTIQTVLGLTGFDLNKVSGFYGVMFMYIALMATIHAVMLGAGTISKEERDRTSEFLMVKPITRNKIISAKILAGFVSIIVINIVTLLSSVYYINFYSNETNFIGDMMLLMMGLLFMQFIFFFVGTLLAAISRKPKLSGSLAAAVLLVAYLLTYLINFNSDFDILKILTPFMYFDAKDILENGSLSILSMALSVTIIIAMTVVTYTTYKNRDLEV